MIMKKQLYAIITILFGAMAYASAGDTPRKQTPKEIFAKYSKMAQANYQKLTPDQKKLNAQNNTEWEQRELIWKIKKSDLDRQKKSDELYKDRLSSYDQQASEILKNNPNLDSELRKLRSWLPQTLYQYLFDNENYQKKLDAAISIKASLTQIESQKAKLIYDHTRIQTEVERSTMKQTMNIWEEIRLIKQYSQKVDQQKNDDEIHHLINTIGTERKLLGSNGLHRKAFVRSSGLSKQNQKLFHEYREQQAKE